MRRRTLLSFLLAPAFACGGVQDHGAGDAATDAHASDGGSDGPRVADATVHRDASDAREDGARSGDAPNDSSTCGVDAGPSPLATPLCFVGGWCTAEPLPFPQRMNGVWGSSATDVWTVGDLGVILHWDGAGWSPASSGTSESLVNAWGSGPADAWAVGDGGVATHWNGTAWAVTPTGTTSNLTSVWGTSPSDAWAVGDGGTILRWDGASWRASPSGTTVGLNGVWASAPTNAWAVGGVFGESSMLLHWTGATWDPVDAGTDEELLSVWGTSPTDIWAGAQESVCCNAIALHFDGATWSQVIVSLDSEKPRPPPTTGPQTSFWGPAANNVYGAGDFLGQWDGAHWSVVASALPPASIRPPALGPAQVWGSGSPDVWGVGSKGLAANVPAYANFHFDGCRWSQAPTYASLFDLGYGEFQTNQNAALWVGDATDIWSGGPGFTLHWDGSAWTQFVMGGGVEGTILPVAGLWGSGASDVWAVGTVDDEAGLYARSYGAVAHWDGAAWSLRHDAIVPKVFARGIWGSGGSDVWIVGESRSVGDDEGNDDAGGDSAVIEHWDGKAWKASATPSSVTLRAVWGSGATDVWAVGDRGTILHGSGKAWSIATSPVTTELDAVWGTSASDAWAAGVGGTLLRWDGTSWKAIPSGTPLPLTSLGGSGAGDVWAGAIPASPGDAQLLHWNGSSWSVASPVWGSVYAVSGLPSGDVWVAGGGDGVPSVFHRHD